MGLLLKELLLNLVEFLDIHFGKREQDDVLVSFLLFDDVFPIHRTAFVHDASVCARVDVDGRDLVVQLAAASGKDILPDGGVDAGDEWEGSVEVIDEVGGQDRQDTGRPLERLKQCQYSLYRNCRLRDALGDEEDLLLL